MKMLSTISKSISGLFVPSTFPISKEVEHGVATYTHSSGDFEFIFQANTDYKISLLRSEVRYKGVPIEKKFYQPDSVTGPFKLHLQRHFIKKIEEVSKLDVKLLQLITDNILGVPELSGVEALELKSTYAIGSNYKEFEVNAYSDVYRVSPIEMSMNYHFRHGGKGSPCRSLSFVEHQNELFVELDRCIDNKPRRYYQDHKLENIIYEMNKLLISMRDESNLHICSFKKPSDLYTSYNEPFFYCGTDNESILLKLHLCLARKTKEQPEDRRFNIFCKWNIKHKTATIKVYKNDGQEAMGMHILEMESRFLDRAVNTNTYESYVCRGISSFSLSEPEDENSHFGHDLDYDYYSDYLNDLIRYIGLKYYPTAYSLHLVGCHDCSGELSENQTAALVDFHANKKEKSAA